MAFSRTSYSTGAWTAPEQAEQPTVPQTLKVLPAPPQYPAPLTVEIAELPSPPSEDPDNKLAFCVRKTFLDVCSSLPQPELARARTAPDASTACSSDDDESDSVVSAPPVLTPERFSSQDSQVNTSVVDAADVSQDGADSSSDDDDVAPPPLMLGSLQTPDWYENTYDGERNVFNPFSAVAFDPLPSLPERVPSMSWHPMRDQWHMAPPPSYPAPMDLEGEAPPSPPAEFPDGNPAYLCVRHTFLDICSSLPTLARSHTAPENQSADVMMPGDDDAQSIELSNQELLLEEPAEPQPIREGLDDSRIDKVGGHKIRCEADRPAYLSVKHTFLDIRPVLPEPELLRASTAPDASAASSIECSSVCSDVADDDEVCALAPPPLALDSFSTPEWYDNPYLLRTPVAKTTPKGIDALPTLAEAEADIPDDDEDCVLPPPPLMLDSFSTPDWYDNPQRSRTPVTKSTPKGIDALPALAEGEAEDAAPVKVLPDASTSSREDSIGMPSDVVHLPDVISTQTCTFADAISTQNFSLSPTHGFSYATTTMHFTPMSLQAINAPICAAPMPPAAQFNVAHLTKVPLAPPPFYPAPITPEGDVEAAPPAGEADADELTSNDAPQVPGLAKVDCPNGKTRVFWAIDERKLLSQDKQAVSPVFHIDLHGEESLQPFRLILHPTARNDGRRGAGFKKSKGKGRIELKCEVPREAGSADIVFRFAVGRDEVRQPTRGVVAFNFAENGSCHGLPNGKNEWDFSKAVDEHKTFLVILEVMPHGRTA